MTENQSTTINLGSTEAENIARETAETEEEAANNAAAAKEADIRASALEQERGIQKWLMRIFVAGNVIFLAIPFIYLTVGVISLFPSIEVEKQKVFLDGLSVFVEQIVPVWIIYVLGSIGTAGVVRIIQALSDIVRSFRSGSRRG